MLNKKEENMAKLYHESREKQMDKKINGMEPSHRENEPYTEHEPMKTENILKKDAVHREYIQLLAYQIYEKKGGTPLDNWLEAESILKYYHHK
jgi:hypothetical protein